jgi:hypothetical protein
MSGLKRPSGAGPRLWLLTWFCVWTSKFPTPITRWAFAGALTVFAAGPLLPLAAMTTAPASNAASAAAEMALRSSPEPCISATITRSSTETATWKARTAAFESRKPPPPG